MQKARRHRFRAPTACSARFQGLFTPFLGFFSPFPHGTGSLSVSQEYLALEDGAPMFRQDFSGPALLNTTIYLSHTGLSPSTVAFQTTSSPTTPYSFRLFPFARHYLGNL
jgi:hypothetical protein